MAEDLDSRIGRNLREIRRKVGLDIDALASLSGLQPAALGQYEAGRMRIPVEVLALLAEVLGRPIGDFFA